MAKQALSYLKRAWTFSRSLIRGFMAFLDNVQDCIFTTKYPIDKVVFKNEGTVSVPTAASPADYTTVTIPHGLGYAPLAIGSYSDDDFATTYNFGSPPYAYNGGAMLWMPSINGIIESDATNIYIYFQSVLSTRTHYYRVVALIPSGITSSVAMDNTTRDNTYFDTTNNYLKILEDEQTTVSVTSTPQTITIPHNLGYEPMAFVFSEESGVIRKAGSENAILITGITTTAYVDTTNLYITASKTSTADMTFHYRIYLDA